MIPLRLMPALLGFVAALAAAPPDPHRPIGRFPFEEASGLVASRRHAGVVWAIRDSGGPAALFAIRVAGGKLAPWPGGRLVRTLPVAGARNVDWEDLALDAQGDLWIADTGNNAEGRRDLKLYRVPEPDPFRDGAARAAGTYPFRYPDRPPWGDSFDAEALFFVDGAAYLVAKTAGHPIYRFPRLTPKAEVVLAPVGRLAEPPRGLGRLVTGAAVSADGRRLAVVSASRRVWVYEAGAPGLTGDALVRDLAARPPRWSAPFTPDEATWQVEAVAFEPRGHAMIMAAEEGPIWRFPAAWYEAYGP